jgi:uncharacterized membrane protein YtjA (UPF0391 family)
MCATLENATLEKQETFDMVSWILTFLVLALVAGLTGFSGVAGAATQVAWILFVIFLALSLIAGISRAIKGRPPV